VPIVQDRDIADVDPLRSGDIRCSRRVADVTDERPRILVWSSLFPSADRPHEGVFIRERMFRVGAYLPVTVISPQPWFPLQTLVRRLRPHFRPPAPRYERQQGIDVFRPRYFSFPAVLKSLDGPFMALAGCRTVRRLKKQGRVDVIDAHFAYPDGYAATKVARWLSLPVTITLRGTEAYHAQQPRLRQRLQVALRAADRIFAVSTSLLRVAVELGIPREHVRVIGNGVDAAMFRSAPREAARAVLGIPPGAHVLITVGSLSERKGFHRVIACMPALLPEFPGLHYLIVGSGGPEGDNSGQLREQVRDLGLEDSVRFLGALSREGVVGALSAADVFVLATRYEGWANVLLEAMACGLPVVTTDVGGNAEVVSRPELGTIVRFDDHDALCSALREALRQGWDRAAIRQYAEQNDWEARVPVLVDEFRQIFANPGTNRAFHARRAP